IRWQLVSIAAIAVALAAVLLPLGLILFDLYFTRVLQGSPLTELEAAILRLPPASTVSVDALTPALRREVAQRTLLAAVAIVAPVWIVGAGLWYWVVGLLQRVNQQVRLQLLDRLQALSLRYHAGAHVGDAVYRLYQDSAMVTKLLAVLLIEPLFAVTG